MKRNIFTRMLQTVLISLIFCAITSCSTLSHTQMTEPTPTLSWEQRQKILAQLHSWQINGKIAVQTTQNSGSATVNWQKTNNRYVINLYGPLGTHGVTLQGQPGAITLQTADGKIFHAKSPEELLSQQWGWDLPVTYLNYWIRGLPVPSLSANKQFDDKNRLSFLFQNPWSVQFTNYETVNGMDLPTRLTISSATFKTKIVIYEWKVL